MKINQDFRWCDSILIQGSKGDFSYVLQPPVQSTIYENVQKMSDMSLFGDFCFA